MPTGNKFAVLSEVNDKKKTLVVSDSNLPSKKVKKPASPADSKPAAPKPQAKAAAAAKPQAKAAKAAGGATATTPDAPTDLRAAAAFNRKKAEEREARAVADRSAAEAHAVKLASEQTQAEVQGASDAAKEAQDEAAAVAAETAPQKEKEPEKPVMTLADYNKARSENRFAIGAKERRSVDATGLKTLQKMESQDEELVIKPKEQPKPTAPAAKGGKKSVAAAPAPKAEKKEKAEKLDINAFADYSAAPRGRGFGRGGFRGGERGGYGGGERGGFGRGGFRGGDRMPNVEDKKAFPTL